MTDVSAESIDRKKPPTSDKKTPASDSASAVRSVVGIKGGVVSECYIVHNGQSHRGEHAPIIDQPLWDAVRVQLAINAAERNSGAQTRQPSLLAGMLIDGDGCPMTPSHAVRKGTRYRYYVSRPLMTKDQTAGSAGLRIPAG